MSYRQLTPEQRYQIYACVKADWTQLAIAAEVGVHPATISRELKRNRGARGYRPKQAQEKAQARKLSHVTSASSHRLGRSLSVTCGRTGVRNKSRAGSRESNGHMSATSAFPQYIYRDKARGGDLHQHLRCRKRRRKRYGAYDRRGRLKNQRSIEERPQVVEQKRRLGDWEADTVIGQNHHQAIVSVVERKSKLTFLKKVARNTAAAVEQALEELLAPVAEQCHTITSDNGREFAHHEAIAAQLRAGFYFAHPYAAWERGLNENTNGLVRQYFPKRSDFSKITDKQVQRVMARLNNRPRKTLGFKTPNQFFKQKPIALTT